MKSHAFFATFITIAGGDVSAPYLPFSAGASPFQGVPFPFSHFGIDNAFDNFASLLHYWRKDWWRGDVPAIVPIKTRVARISTQTKIISNFSPVLRRLLPSLITVNTVIFSRVKGCTMRALN